jgi:hypothetical protein
VARLKRVKPASEAIFSIALSGGTVPNEIGPEAKAFGVQQRTEAPE